MKHHHVANVVFAKHIPRELEAGVFYVSMDYATAIHACMCGCGREVVTPFGRASWTITYDGERVSLWPSIGNGAFPCRSHYIVRDGRIVWLKKDENRAHSPRASEQPSFFGRLAAWFGASTSGQPK